MKRLVLPVLLVCVALMAGCRGPTREEIELAARMNAQARDANSRAHIAFDPSHDALVSDFVPDLIGQYDLRIGYKPEEMRGEIYGHTSYRSVRYPDCKLPAGADRFDLSMRALGKDKRACLLIARSQPVSQGAVVTTLQFRKLTVDGVKTGEHRIVIQRPDGASTSVVYYTARDEWSSRQIGRDAIAAALGLSKGTASDADLPDKEETDRLIAEISERHLAAVAEWVAELAATGKLPGDREKFSTWQIPPSVIAANAELLLHQLDLGLAPDGYANNRRVISGLLAALPEDEWTRRSPQILAMLKRHSPLEERDTFALLVRLSEIGPAALPILAKVTSTRDLPTATVIGACKIGQDAVPVLGQRLLEDWRRQNIPIRRSPNSSGGGLRSLDYRACVEEGERNGPPEEANDICWQKPEISTSHGHALYFALKRMGMGDDADRMAKHLRAARWERDWGNIGPSSPVNVCTDNLEP